MKTIEQSMVLFVSDLLVVLALLLTMPIVVLLLEVAAAFFSSRSKTELQSRQKVRPRVAVLLPAHNEGASMLATINGIKAQLRKSDRLLVVADNCTDDTAAVAIAAGAETAERNEPTKFGKGFALDFGLEHLSSDPPGIVIVIDADCIVGEGAIDQLAAKCAFTGRPVQALYLMTAPEDSPINYRVAEFAWRVKNWVRPLGLNALKLPCQLMGTGMAFPWAVIRGVDLANGSIVEDLKLGLELAQLTSPPIFCPHARVWSHFPWSVAASNIQRSRWERGHIGMIGAMLPFFVWRAIINGNLSLLALALDMAIPPLSFLVILLAAFLCIAGIGALFGCSAIALLICTVCLAIFSLTLFFSWVRFGRDILPADEVLAIPSYIVAKLSIYRRLFSTGRTSQWIRTDRKKSE